MSEVPISITAATGPELADRGIQTTADLGKITPGLTFTESNYGAPIYTLRGVGGFVEALAFSPNVSVYVDQVPLPYSRLTEGASLDPERVEVLKGPQGTLFGQNSTGGAINYVAAKPTPSLEAGLDLTYGRFDEIDVGGYVSGPITGNLGARLAFRSEHRGGWQKNSATPESIFTDPTASLFGYDDDKNGVRDFSTARLILAWQPDSDIKIELNLNGWFNRSDMQQKQYAAYAPLVPGGADVPVEGVESLQDALRNYPQTPHDNRHAGWDPGVSNRRDDKFYQAALRIEYQLSPAIQLTSITAFDHAEVFGPTDLDGTVLPVARNNVTGNFDNFSQELRMAGQALAGDALKWLIGANYAYDKINDIARLSVRTTNSGIPLPAGATTQVGGVPLPDGGQIFYFEDFLNVARQKVHTAAVFGSLTYDVTPQITVEASARYTDRHNSYSGCLVDPYGSDGAFARTLAAISQFVTGAANPPVAPASGCITLNSDFTFFDDFIDRKLNEDNFSYRGSVSWRPSSDHMLYASITKGYKAGAFENLSAVSVDQVAPVPQESVLAYEVGFKSAFFDRELQLDAAAFYYDYRSKQLADYVNNFVFGILPALVSIPKSRVQGFEASLTTRPAEGLTVNVAATYLDTKVLSSYVTPGLVGITTDIKGSTFPLTPKWQVTANIDHVMPISDRLNAFLGASALYHSKATPAFVSGPYTLPSYATLDLRAGIETQDGKYRLELWGRNVTDEYYLTTYVHTGDDQSRLTGMPATYGLTFRTRFE
nr:TonB-dependent receptor [Stakelama flava]